MSPTVVLGATLIVGGVLYFLLGKPKYINVLPLIPPPNQQYPIPAETSRYSEPPASEVSSLPPISSACSITTPDEYNALAGLMGLPLFTGYLATNSPDDPARQEFNELMTGMKTKGGCFGVENQKSTSLSLPSYSGDQSISYK
jgi:hypothetical protein